MLLGLLFIRNMFHMEKATKISVRDVGCALRSVPPRGVADTASPGQPHLTGPPVRAGPSLGSGIMVRFFLARPNEQKQRKNNEYEEKITNK